MAGNYTPPIPGWEWKQIGDLVTFEYGKSLRADKRTPEGTFNVYGSNGIVGKHDKYLVDKPCLIIGRKGAAGEVHISTQPCWPIDTTYYVVPPENLNLNYLFYTLLSLNLASLDRSTAIPGLNRNDAYTINFPLPPLPEQERIVERIESLFTRLDAGVVGLKRVQVALKRYRASVLKAAFEGRLVPQDPNDESAVAILRRVLAKSGEYFIHPDGGLAELPNGWCWARVQQIADTIGGITKGRNFKGKKTISLPYLRVANVQRGQLDLRDMKEIELLEEEIERYRLIDGDIVLTEGGDWDKLGRSAIWKDNLPICVHQNHIFRARLKSSDISNKWVMYYTNSEQGQNYFKDASKQTTNLASINLTQLRNCPIPIPPVNEQNRIVANVDRLLSVVQELEQAVSVSLKRATRLRQAILKQAYEGRLS